jgi:selenophosphate synthase
MSLSIRAGCSAKATSAIGVENLTKTNIQKAFTERMQGGAALLMAQLNKAART